MKMLKVSFAILTVFACLFTSCVPEIISGSGQIVSENRTISTEFKEIRVSGSATCFVKQGDSVKVVAKDHANILSLLETKVVGNTLVISYRDNTWVQNSAAEVTVTVPKLTMLEISGSGDIATIGNFRFDDLGLQISGSGDIVTAGSAKKLNAKISGSGDIKTFNMPCDTATVRVSGSGDIQVHANRLLDATISGSGDIVYKGSPTVNTSISGSGSVRRY